MKALIVRNRFSLPLLGMGLAGAAFSLLLAAATDSLVMAEVGSLFGVVVLASSGWLLFKLMVWLMKPVWAQWLAAVFVVGVSWCVGSVLLAIGGLLVVASATAYWWCCSQFVPSAYEMSYKEKLYWFWVNEFMDGRTSFLPRKPKR